MGSISNIRYLGWGLVTAVVLNFIGALRFANPDPMDYIIISGMLVAYLPFFIFPFRVTFAGKSFWRCVVVGWESFFLSQFLQLFVCMGLDLRYIEHRGEEFQVGGAILVSIFLGWIPGLIISAVAFACKKIVDRVYTSTEGVFKRIPLLVLIGVLCGVVFLVCRKAPEGISLEAIQVDLQSVKVMTNSIGMKLVWIPPGEFQMGSHEYDDPVHTVKLTRGFWMGQFEVTQDQYQGVMGTNPSEFKGGNLPVERVSLNDAMEFSRKLGSQEGKNYRLPTEAEWEYACRSGTTTKYSFGDSVGLLWQYGNYCDASNKSPSRDSVRDRRHNDQYDNTSPVGSFKPNPWGLYDMHGNVWEWCSDWYERGYGSEAVTDPTGPQKGQTRVLRGGCWNSGTDDCRSSARNWAVEPVYKSDRIGFRVVLESE